MPTDGQDVKVSAAHWLPNALRDLIPIVKRITILRYQDIDNVYNESFMVIQIVKVSGLICIGNPG